MNRVRPRSLLQVVLIGFLLVLMPLGGMIWHNSIALEHLSQLTSQGMETVVKDTRRVTLLTAQDIDIERNLRRFAVLGEKRSLTAFQKQLASYRALLDEHRRSIPDSQVYQRLEEALSWLASLNDAALARAAVADEKFKEFNQFNQQLEIVTSHRVDEQVASMHQAIEKLTKDLWWVSSFVAALSLFLALIFGYLIIHPVRQIESRILSLGAGVEPDLQPINGPAELVLLGERIVWLHGKLKELESQKYQFLRHVSHELKTPLAVLREGAALLNEQLVGPLTPEQREICQMLDENSRRLQALIEHLLNFNRITQQTVFELTDVPLLPMLNQLVAEYRLALESKKMQVHLPDEAISLCAEPYRLGVILDNLFSNAVSYGNQGGHIWIRAGQQGGGWLEVANEGPAIPIDEQQRIFEPFEQGSATRQGVLKGSGMGLSIARESAISLGGTLALVEDDKANVCFRLTLT